MAQAAERVAQCCQRRSGIGEDRYRRRVAIGEPRRVNIDADERALHRQAAGQPMIGLGELGADREDDVRGLDERLRRGSRQRRAEGKRVPVGDDALAGDRRHDRAANEVGEIAQRRCGGDGAAAGDDERPARGGKEACRRCNGVIGGQRACRQ